MSAAQDAYDRLMAARRYVSDEERAELDAAAARRTERRRWAMKLPKPA